MFCVGWRGVANLVIMALLQEFLNKTSHIIPKNTICFISTKMTTAADKCYVVFWDVYEEVKKEEKKIHAERLVLLDSLRRYSFDFYGR